MFLSETFCEFESDDPKIMLIAGILGFFMCDYFTHASLFCKRNHSQI